MVNIRRTAPTAVMAALVMLSVLAGSVAFAGTVSAQPTVSVSSDAVVTPGETTTIIVEATAADQIQVSGEVGSWVVNSTNPSGFSTFPSSADTPYTSQSGDTWGHLFGAIGNHTFEVTVTAPETTGTYNLTAEAVDNEANSSVTSEFTLVVAESGVDISHAGTVQPGAETTLTLDGTAVSELRLASVPSGWSLTDAAATPEAGVSLSPGSDALPTESDASDNWTASYSEPQAAASYDLTVEASDAEGTYEFTAVGVAGGTTVTETFSIAVADIVDSDDRVAPSNQTTFTVSADGVDEINISGEVDGWVVNSTNPSGLSTFPSSDDTPYTSQSNDTWGNLFAATGNHTFEVTVTAPATSGTYDFTATALDNESVEQQQNFTVEVTDQPAQHESGVPTETYSAVDDGNDGLSSEDIRNAVRSYFETGSVEGVPITSEDIRSLVRFYFSN